MVRAEEKGLKIRLQVDSAVPACLVGDHGRLCQVLTNLVGNAVKFSQQGQISVEVSLVSQVKDDVTLQIRVADTGIGIAEEACQRIFNQFEQADGSTTRKFGGTGLGLAICKKLVQLMGGEIGVESRLGGGSCFHFTARFLLGSEELLPTERSAALVSSQLRQAPMDVLVADDVEINRAIVQALLEPHGYRITCVENGLKAVEAFESKRYDVVLMDVQMPVMDGLQATRAMRNYERAMGRSVPVPIVAMTAIAGNEDRQVCLESGMDDYLTKPLKPGQLLQLLNKFCHHPIESVGATRGIPPASALNVLPAERGKSAPVFDRNELLERLGGRSEMIPRFVDLFCKGVLPHMEGLEAALAAGDADGVRRHAHAIKGSAGNIAALQMHKTASLLEKSANEGDLTEAPQRLAMLQDEYRAFTEAVASGM
ncbi:MAG: response regulator [Geobacteraceae bacterium]|nr:response regulator [Geobacteraceae bacterium]